jgi:hypothetical protein
MKKLLLSVVFGACAVGSAYAMEEKQEETQEPTRSEPLALDDLEIPQDARFYIEMNKERFEVSRKVFGSFGVLVASVFFNKYSGSPLYQNLLALKGSKKKIVELEEQKKKVMDQIKIQEGVVTQLSNAQEEPDNLMSRLQSEEMAAQKEVKELKRALKKEGLPDTEKKKMTNRQNEQEKIKANSIERQKQLRGQLNPLRIKEEEAKRKLDELKRELNKLKKQEVIETEELRDLTKEIEKKEKARTENFNPSEIVFKWQDKTIAKHEVTLIDIKTLMNFAEQGFKIEQVSDEDIPVLLLLNDYLQGPQKAGEELQNALIYRIKNLQDKDYSHFLQAQGFLWKVVNIVPDKILKAAHCIDFVVEPDDGAIQGDFQLSLSDGRIVVSKLHGNCDYVEVWQEGSKKYEMRINGEFKTLLTDGSIVVRNSLGYIEVWRKDGKKYGTSIKGKFKLLLPDNRIIVSVIYDGDDYVEAWKASGKKSDWKIKGELESLLPDSRIVVSVMRDNDSYTEVWSVGGNKPDLSISLPDGCKFKTLLPDGRIVLGVQHGNSWYTEVWKVGGNKPDWRVEGEFVLLLPDGRIVVRVYHGHDINYVANVKDTEVWRVGGKQPDLRAPHSEFRALLSDGRMVVRRGGRYDHEYVEVWRSDETEPDLSIDGEFKALLPDGRVVVYTSRAMKFFSVTRTFGQQILLNALSYFVDVAPRYRIGEVRAALKHALTYIEKQITGKQLSHDKIIWAQICLRKIAELLKQLKLETNQQAEDELFKTYYRLVAVVATFEQPAPANDEKIEKQDNS